MMKIGDVQVLICDRLPRCGRTKSLCAIVDCSASSRAVEIYRTSKLYHYYYDDDYDIIVVAISL